MATFPSYSINAQNIKYRHGERYISESTNRKFLGIPRGVYVGYLPSFSGNTLTLSPDSTYNISLARLTSQDDPLSSLDVVTESSVSLDFSGHTTSPVNVILRANGALGQPHSAELITQVAAPSDPTEILICVVVNDALYHGSVTDGPYQAGETISGEDSGATATVDEVRDGFLRVTVTSGTFEVGENIVGGTSTATAALTSTPTFAALYDAPTNRSTPFAYTGAPLGYGFMPSGSVEDLLNAVAMVAEVEAARVDLTGTNHPYPPGLGERIDADAAGGAIADRLGKEIRTIVSEDYTTTGPEVSLNVSSSFAAPHRSNSPVENIRGFASETRTGAITSGTLPVPTPSGALSDTTRNICGVIDTSTERRLATSDHKVAYGRLTLSEVEITGTVTYNGTTSVSGSGTSFDTQIESGDIIEHPSGDYYEVASVGGPTSLTLTLAAPAAADSGLLRRRFEIFFIRRVGAAAENTVTVAGGTTIRFFFPVWRDIENSQFDYLTNLFRNFDSVPVDDATTATRGRALLTTYAAEGKAGSITEIQDTGNVVGDGHFHTINFSGAADGGGGVANITQRGPQGPTGPDAPPGTLGPAGPTGPSGPGFERSKPFAASSRVDTATFSPGSTWTVTYDFSADSISELLFISSGVADWEPYSNAGDDRFEIADVQKISSVQMRVTGFVPTGVPQAYVAFLFNGAGLD